MSAPKSRYIPHTNVPPSDLKAVKTRIHDALVENVPRVHRHPSSNPKVYTGSAGEIIMDMRAFAVMPPKSFPSTPTSSLIAVPFHEPQHGNRVSYLETSVGPATLILVRQLRLRQNPESTAHKHAKRGRLDAEALEDIELAETWRGAVDLVSTAHEVALAEPIDDDGCEVLYGRAGLLYAFLLLRSELAITLSYLSHTGKPKEKVVRELESLTSDENIKSLVDDIVKRGDLGASLYAEELEETERHKAPPLMWRWHGSRYLGAAHGVVGILHVILHAPSAILRSHWEKILGTVQWLLAIQHPLGNWPTKAGRHMLHISGGAAAQADSKRLGVDEEFDDALVQWCHGATGFVMLFSSLLRRSAVSPTACPLPDSLRESVLAATTRAAELVYTRGLSCKGAGLCHGTAGNVYALVSLSDALGEAKTHYPESHPSHRAHSHSISLSRSLSHSHQIPPEVEHSYWLMRALHLADLATGYKALAQEGKMVTPDHPYSLYEGVAGMCCVWAQLLVRLDGKAPGDGNGNAARCAGMPGFDDLALLE
ncbi:hypothetical protein C8Q80DRAFT_1175179 [Daedaleopsis nitida]|nr:hypothetical protein C8Q80DRAFT_1175179 [Daedaleopsis nitida]